ncbi:MAG: hypothetical protein HY245_06030 [Rhizobiales bacterium]|nr:hypothetical protein [Hyphomicrobiales bacterium]MBI3672964.1 hypothetical protein [Hyphomicrobiales bacterium]
MTKNKKHSPKPLKRDPDDVPELTAEWFEGAYFASRASRADLAWFERLMARTGGQPPREGDEIPKGYRRTKERRS